MGYEIKGWETVVTNTVYVTVKFDFLEDNIIIPVVNPTDEDYILQSIANREISELAKLNENEN